MENSLEPELSLEILAFILWTVFHDVVVMSYLWFCGLFEHCLYTSSLREKLCICVASHLLHVISAVLVAAKSFTHTFHFILISSQCGNKAWRLKTCQGQIEFVSLPSPYCSPLLLYSVSLCCRLSECFVCHLLLLLIETFSFIPLLLLTLKFIDYHDYSNTQQNYISSSLLCVNVS